jgi:hypothetical protein
VAVVGGPVARHRLHVEADHDPAAVGARIGGGKIAEDAVADLVALGLYADGLGNREVAVALNLRIADEAQDALDRLRRPDRHDRKQKRNDNPPREQHGFCLRSLNYGL